MTIPSKDAMSSRAKFKKFLENARLGLPQEKIEEALKADNPFRRDPNNPFLKENQNRKDA